MANISKLRTWPRQQLRLPRDYHPSGRCFLGSLGLTNIPTCNSINMVKELSTH
uniref:Uncharacterized protein n=1 Tax=Rhizophora mucronata TaxID=61149 RepID=A0A2P2NZD9_RHIMU